MAKRRNKKHSSKRNLDQQVKISTIVGQIALIDELFGGMGAINNEEDFIEHMHGVYDRAADRKDMLIQKLREN